VKQVRDIAKYIKPMLLTEADIDAFIDSCVFKACEARYIDLPVAMDDRFKDLLNNIGTEDWLKDDAIAWLYQYCAHSSKTRFYTPKWIIKYIVDNTLLPFVKQSGKSVQNIKLLDPACGGGAFLLYAYDCFYNLYIEEGCINAADIPYAILKNNLYGVDIDKHAVRIASLNLKMKAMPAKVDMSDIRVEYLEQPMGSLLRKNAPNILAEHAYDIVVGNPPYMNNRKMPPHLRQSISKEYKCGNTDLYAAFVERGLELLHSNGYLGYVTPDTYIYTARFEKLRELLLENYHITKFIHLGDHIFKNASISVAVLIVLNNKDEIGESQFYDLRSSVDKEEALSKLKAAGAYAKNQDDFKLLPQKRFLYNIPVEILPVFYSLLSLSPHYAEVKQGLATGCNDRFVYMRWEVNQTELGKRWIPYAKGGGFNKYFGRNDFVIDWLDNGSAVKAYKGSVIRNEDYYFKEGITFSLITYDNFNARYMPQGYIFDVGGSAIFTKDVDLHYLLGFLNSRLASYLLAALNPTINFQVGDVYELPFKKPDKMTEAYVSQLTRDIIELKKQLYKYDVLSELYETDGISELLSLGRQGDLYILCSEFQNKIKNTFSHIKDKISAIDEAVFELYGLNDQSRCYICHQVSCDGDMSILPSFAEIVGRYLQSVARKIVEDHKVIHIKSLLNAMHKSMTGDFEHNISNIESQIANILGKDISTWIQDDFANDYLNNAGYGKKNPYEPLIWKGQSKGKCFTVYVWRYAVSSYADYEVEALLSEAAEYCCLPAQVRDIQDYRIWFKNNGIRIRVSL